ncbi:MAG: secondary thiamine-phosphate synthase enzyme YjbQ [Candidatus Omnitrophica bacterium]|jgi:secondary thiamine-phosphate synthase enzyme|nr:secondary thiamine-phosphate synthase enzyme YjbQ [Candidatus Omnitrophota bacterium]
MSDPDLISLPLKTRGRIELLDVTDLVRGAVSRSGVLNGLCHVFSPHTTAAVTINENADPDVKGDMIMALDNMVPLDIGYKHSEGNSRAHVMASLIGSSVTVCVQEGRMTLGTWQGIYFCEFDGPRSRKIYVSVFER